MLGRLVRTSEAVALYRQLLCPDWRYHAPRCNPNRGQPGHPVCADTSETEQAWALHTGFLCRQLISDKAILASRLTGNFASSAARLAALGMGCETGFWAACFRPSRLRGRGQDMGLRPADQGVLCGVRPDTAEGCLYTYLATCSGH